MALLARARESLCRLHGLAVAPEAGRPGMPATPGLDQCRGAFVSLHAGGELRGCIGALDPTRPLAELIDELAVAAATRDPRISPHEAGELATIHIEISVLTPARAITSPAAIRVGDHGLVVARGSRRGLLLPQVAVERGWNAETFLHHTCLKAGLDGEAWRPWAAGTAADLQVQVFTAQVFGEPRQ
jgi:AmmeMemoRadiSam system protein A